MPLKDTKGRILVVGLGNSIMSDDAIGLIVAQNIEDKHLSGVDTCQETVGGLDIIPILLGYHHAIIIDAIKTEQYEPGTVMIFDLKDFESTIADTPTHGINLTTAIVIGKKMNPEEMPVSVKFVAVEVEDVQTMHEGLTEKVNASIKKATTAVEYLIQEFQKSN